MFFTSNVAPGDGAMWPYEVACTRMALAVLIYCATNQSHCWRCGVNYPYICICVKYYV